MDKTCIIILLLVIIVIAIFYKKDESPQNGNINKYYQQINKGFEDITDDISSGAKNAFGSFGEGVNNTVNNLDNHFDNMNKKTESFNSKKILNSYNKDLMYTNPNLIQIVAKSGDNFLTVTDMNGIQEGDKIIINPKGRNREANFVIGLGNNILKLSKSLKYNHHPNEKVYNVSNDDANPTNSRFPDVGYGYIDTETRDIGFSPEDNTWAFNLNMNEKQIRGWCGPDSQFLKKSKMPTCIEECKKHPRCSAVRWINHTNDCSLMKSCNKTNDDKNWSHMYMHKPTFKMGGPECDKGQKSLNENDCRDLAKSQDIPFYKWTKDNQWPKGCFQYEVDGNTAIAHNPTSNTTWPNSGYEATQYCK